MNWVMPEWRLGDIRHTSVMELIRLPVALLFDPLLSLSVSGIGHNGVNGGQVSGDGTFTARGRTRGAPQRPLAALLSVRCLCLALVHVSRVFMKEILLE